jgi:ABC-type enterochelin transport system substrate-binding protein
MLGGDDISYAYEVHEIDPKTQTHTIKSVNLTYANLMRVEETCTYQPAQDKTIFLQEAKIAAFGAISRFAHYVEDFSVKRFCENATVGRMGFEKVLESVEGNGLNVL